MTFDNDKPAGLGDLKDDDEGEGEEHMETEEEANDPLKSAKAFKALVVKTLEDNQMDQKRASKMEIIDFLNLLRIFNEQGIHFK